MRRMNFHNLKTCLTALLVADLKSVITFVMPFLMQEVLLRFHDTPQHLCHSVPTALSMASFLPPFHGDAALAFRPACANWIPGTDFD
jgi:hypothetical protein